MTLFLTLQLSDGRHETAVSSLDDFSGDYSLCGVDISIRETDADSEFSLSLSADWGASIERLMISADLGGTDVKILNTGTDSSSVIKPVTGEKPFIVRNVFMSEGRNGIINLAFSSCSRYYTYFDYKDGYVSAIIDLENKAIKAGEIYRLESVMIDDSVCAQVFLNAYSFNLAMFSCARIRSSAYYAEPASRVNICEYMGNPEDPASFRKSKAVLTDILQNAAEGAILITHLTELLYTFYNPISKKKQRDYGVSLFRRCLKMLRECAGRRVLLADSDSPSAECTGFFDGIYSGNPSSLRYYSENYDYFGYLSDIASDLARKSAFHGICFANKGKLDSSDIFSYEERKMWFFASSFNGARPIDLWEKDYISHTVLTVNGNSVKTEFHILYNWDSEPKEFTVRALEQSCFIDCYSKKIVETSGSFYDFVLPAHTARAILVKALPRHSALLYADSDIHLGAGVVRDFYFGQSLRIYAEPVCGSVFFYMPYGSEDEVYLNDKLISLSRLKFEPIDGGKVFNILSKF